MTVLSLSLSFCPRSRMQTTLDDRSAATKTAFQLNSGTKSDERGAEGGARAEWSALVRSLPAESAVPSLENRVEGFKALRAPITPTTRREVSHRIDPWGFLSWRSTEGTPRTKVSVGENIFRSARKIMIDHRRSQCQPRNFSPPSRLKRPRV